MVKKKRETEMLEMASAIIVEDASTSLEEENEGFTRLSTSLEKIRGSEGVIGYIIRNTGCATIDLKDPSSLANYALLSAEIFDFFKELFNLFSLSEQGSMLVEGKTAKVLCLLKGRNNISIFLQKDADEKRVLNEISEQE